MIKKTNILVVMILIASVCGNAQADVIWESGHHVYSEGSETFVNMYNDASAEISGGWIGEFSMYNDTTAEITGGFIGILRGQDTSHVDVYGGSDIGLLRPNDFSTANVFEGEINHLFVLGNSITNVYGGNFAMGFSANDSALIQMYVQDYNWDPEGGSSSSFGVLTGTWLNSGESFLIDHVALSAFDNIVFVPEPGTVLVLGVGIFWIRNINV